MYKECNVWPPVSGVQGKSPESDRNEHLDGVVGDRLRGRAEAGVRARVRRRDLTRPRGCTLEPSGGRQHSHL